MAKAELADRWQRPWADRTDLRDQQLAWGARRKHRTEAGSGATAEGGERPLPEPALW